MAENARPPIDGGTVLITGASAGIGRELAVQLAPRARTLILLARRAGRLEELRTTLLAKHPQLQVLTLPVDLSDETDAYRIANACAPAAAAGAVAPTGRPIRHTAPQHSQERSQSAEPAGRTSTDMRISRLILSGAAIGTIIGTGRADLNSTHVFNPAWPPHARFHNATGWGTVTGSQLLALWLLWRPGQQASDRDTSVTTAALLSTIAWVPFFPALAISGADVEDEPGHLPRVAGVPINLLPAGLIPVSCALGYLLHRHGQ